MAMIEGFDAPADLAEARSRVAAVTSERCQRLGVDRFGADQLEVDAVVHLEGKRFSQQELLSSETAVVVADMILWQWDDASLRELADGLAPGAALVFCEPTADLGWRRTVHRVGQRRWRSILKHNFESDVPARLRATGLIVTTMDRFSIGPLGIRSYVWGQAEHLRPVKASSV